MEKPETVENIPEEPEMKCPECGEDHFKKDGILKVIHAIQPWKLVYDYMAMMLEIGVSMRNDAVDNRSHHRLDDAVNNRRHHRLDHRRCRKNDRGQRIGRDLRRRRC